MPKVSVVSCHGRLRLEWRPHKGSKKKYLSVGMPDSVMGRRIADAKAIQIQNDLDTGNYDPTLKKYKPTDQGVSPEGLDVVVTRFIDYKRSHDLVGKSVLNKCRMVKGNLVKCFGASKPISHIEARDARKFRDWLLDKGLERVTVKKYLIQVNAIWKWAYQQRLVGENPWPPVVKTVRVPEKKIDPPFTKDEIKRIVDHIHNKSKAAHYEDLIVFLFETGVRLEEAFGLRWKSVEPDCSSVWIGEVFTFGEFKPTTKTKSARTIRLQPSLQTRLMARRDRIDDKPQSLVFPAKRGGGIHSSLLWRLWTQWLNELDIPYRSPYHTRHTWISHALLSLSPARVAEYAGNSPETIYKNYAGSIQSGQLPPGLLD